MTFQKPGVQILVDDKSDTVILQNGQERTEPPLPNDYDYVVEYWVTPRWSVGDAFHLGIPSGDFKGTVVSVQPGDEGIQIVLVQGVWDGKQGGANGGRSGLGDFSFTEITSVEGTFGKAKSLDEYNARANRYRSQYWNYETDPEGACSWVLTTAGEKILRQWLGSLRLTDAAAAEANTPVQYALARVGEAIHRGGYSIEPNLQAWVNLYISDIPVVTHKNGEEYVRYVGFREFKQWLDLQFPKLNGQLDRQKRRSRLHPTARNLRRLKQYTAAFAEHAA